MTPVVQAGLLELAEPAVPHPAGPLRQAHALLRGRYWLAATLALIGIAAGGLGGYHVQKPLYKSTGLIRVQPYLARILYESDETGLLPMFDAFIGSQVELIQGQRVTDLAMQDPEWVALGRGLAPGQIVGFRESLSVSRPKGSELVLVGFEDEDPNAAQLGVKVIMGAYEKLYGERAGDGVNDRIRVLEEYRLTLESELKSYGTRTHSLSSDYGGAAALEQVYQFKLGELNKLESELWRSELAIALASGAEAGGAADPAVGAAAGEESLEELAQRFPELDTLLNTRREVERQLRMDRTQLGENHRRVKDAQAYVSVLDQEIDDLVETYRATESTDAGAEIAGRFAGKTLAQLTLEGRNVRSLYESARKETLELGRKKADIDRLMEGADDVKAKLTETKARLEQLNFERKAGGRIIVESTGDRPVAPSTDKRLQFASAGALGTGGLGLSLVLLLGLIDRRVRVLSDVKDDFKRLTRVLGVLPQLPEDMDDAEQAILAAHGVHQIRTALQGRHKPEEKPVIAITSPSPGSGKTSLSIALGMSFAASGSRTLIIDCDVIGGGLTAKLRHVARRRLGHVLRRQGVITSGQLIEALKLRAKGDQRMGEVLIELGYATFEEVEAALQSQRESLVGLMEAMSGDPVQECLTETGTPGLFLLPLGAAERHHAGELSQAALRRVFDVARTWFDVIIVDTGPVLGSLEAAVVARVADEVVLTIARGEARGSVESSLEQLSAAGAEVTGVVFNRAGMPDILRSGFSSSISRASGSGFSMPDRMPVIEHKHLRLGPIGTAVAAMSELPRRHSPSAALK